jgi:hypothetical protein
MNQSGTTDVSVGSRDETYRRARVKAAERETFVSALVRRFLAELAGSETDVERLTRQEREKRIGTFRAGR